MLALPQEYIGSACEIKSMNNDLLSVGRIIKIDNEALELAANDGERMPLLQYRTPVKLFVHNTRLGTRILVGVAYLSTDNFARLEEVRPLQDFERRGAFRVNTDVTGKLSRLLNEDEQAAFDEQLALLAPQEAREALEASMFEVQILDMSLTGLRLYTPRTLAVGERFFIEFQLLDAVMKLCLRIQRTIETPHGVQFGCIFFDFSEKQMDALWKALFQLQRIEKSKRRNAVL